MRIRSQPRGLLALVPLTFALMGCVVTSSSVETVATPRLVHALPSPARTGVDPGSDPTNARAIPVSGHAEPGVLYAYELYLHCGIDYWASWDFDGSFWDVTEPSASDPRARDLESIGVDRGTIELITTDAARYTATTGLVIELARSPDAERRGVMCA